MVCPVLETIFIYASKSWYSHKNARSCCQHIFFHHFSSVFTCSSPMSSSNMLSSRPTHSGGFTLCCLGKSWTPCSLWIRISSRLHSYEVHIVLQDSIWAEWLKGGRYVFLLLNYALWRRLAKYVKPFIWSLHGQLCLLRNLTLWEYPQHKISWRKDKCSCQSSPAAEAGARSFTSVGLKALVPIPSRFPLIVSSLRHSEWPRPWGLLDAIWYW